MSVADRHCADGRTVVQPGEDGDGGPTRQAEQDHDVRHWYR